MSALNVSSKSQEESMLVKPIPAGFVTSFRPLVSFFNQTFCPEGPFLTLAELLFLCWGSSLWTAVRPVPSAFHEPRYMGIAIHNELLLSTTFHLVRYSPRPDRHAGSARGRRWEINVSCLSAPGSPFHLSILTGCCCSPLHTPT